MPKASHACHAGEARQESSFLPLPLVSHQTRLAPNVKAGYMPAANSGTHGVRFNRTMVL
ncbi:hypothetical protein PUN4_180094 [Paraburkholderia unamae]|nr:hypothetical protein PUN4_180094 [Paraburkholderia unamae]